MKVREKMPPGVPREVPTFCPGCRRTHAGACDLRRTGTRGGPVTVRKATEEELRDWNRRGG